MRYDDYRQKLGDAFADAWDALTYLSEHANPQVDTDSESSAIDIQQRLFKLMMDAESMGLVR